MRGHTCKIFITKYLDHDAGFVLPFVGSLAVCKTRQCPLSYAICMWCCRVQSLNLKGTPHKDASWPGNGENMYKILPLIFQLCSSWILTHQHRVTSGRSTLKIHWHQFKPLNHKSKAGSQFWTQYSESRRDEEEGGELYSHEEVRHFCGSRRDQEQGGGTGV